MQITSRLFVTIIAAVVLNAGYPAFATDLDTVIKKTETAKGHVDNIKKEGGEAKQNVKDLKVTETMKNAGNAKDEGKKLKDVVTGK